MSMNMDEQVFIPRRDWQELNAPVDGTIIRPYNDDEVDPPPWFTVALKIANQSWTVTGHGHIVLSKNLQQFADRWKVVHS